MTRRLAREEGLLVGGSSGMAVVAALRIAQDLGEHDVVVVLLPDHGRGYLDKLYDDEWMTGHGFAVAAPPEPRPVPELVEGPGSAGRTLRQAQRPADSEPQPLPTRPTDPKGSEMTIETDKTATAAIHAGQAADPYTGGQ